MGRLNVLVRPAVASEAGGIVQIHIRCWQENFRGLIDDKALRAIDANAWLLRQEERLRSRACFVAEADGQLVGFGECGPVRDKAYGSAGEIHSLFVSPGAQGGGVGHALFMKLREELERQGFRRLIVKTMRDSPESREFYERQGCRWEGESSFEFAGRSYPEAVYVLSLTKA